MDSKESIESSLDVDAEDIVKAMLVLGFKPERKGGHFDAAEECH